MTNLCKCCGHDELLHWREIYCSPAETGCEYHNCKCERFVQ